MSRGSWQFRGQGSVEPEPLPFRRETIKVPQIDKITIPLPYLYGFRPTLVVQRQGEAFTLTNDTTVVTERIEFNITTAALLRDALIELLEEE